MILVLTFHETDCRTSFSKLVLLFILNICIASNDFSGSLCFTLLLASSTFVLKVIPESFLVAFPATVLLVFQDGSASPIERKLGFRSACGVQGGAADLSLTIVATRWFCSPVLESFFAVRVLT